MRSKKFGTNVDTDGSQVGKWKAEIRSFNQTDPYPEAGIFHTNAVDHLEKSKNRRLDTVTFFDPGSILT